MNMEYVPEAKVGIEYVTDEEFSRYVCLCGQRHQRSDYVQMPCRWTGFTVERSYLCPMGKIVSWCKRSQHGVRYGKL